MTEPRNQAERRDQHLTPRGAAPRGAPRTALGGVTMPFVVNLWADAGVFAVAAGVIAIAVWRQDPGAPPAEAPTNRVALRAMWHAPVQSGNGQGMPPESRQVAYRGSRTLPATGGG